MHDNIIKEQKLKIECEVQNNIFKITKAKIPKGFNIILTKLVKDK
jgi:hypothetical protein